MRSARYIVLLLLCAPLAAGAQQAAGVRIILDRSAQCDFVPARAFFIIDFGGDRVEKLAAEVMVAHGEASAAEPGTWYFGAGLIVPPGTKLLQHALLVEGGGGAQVYLPPRMLMLTDENLFGASADNLREFLLQRKSKLESWQVQLRVQRDSLERLRADADVIGNLGRIAERAEELQRVRMQTGDVEKDMQNLQRFIRLASKGPEPRNFVRRKHSLTEQLDELVRAARDMEAGERQRKNRSELDLHRDLKLVETTRNDNYDALREELSALRRKRMALEEQYMRAAGREEDDYKPPENR